MWKAVNKAEEARWFKDDKCSIQNDIVNIGLHFFLKNVRPYAAACCEV